MSTIAPVNLHFDDSGDWHSLPEWAEYFINIGKKLASADQSETRIVTAIVVPTRAYGAAFVSLGMVISDAAARDRASETAHFEAILNLPPGTPVVYRLKPGKTMRGVLREPEDNQFIRVQVHSDGGGSLTYFVNHSNALKVQPARHSGKLPKKQDGRNARFANDFVDGLLGDADPVQLGLRSKLCCAIVGRTSLLEHEICKTPLALNANGKLRAHGHLQDVLRLDRFVSEQRSYRSALVAVGASSPSPEVINNVEMGVVFDGAHGFLKWGNLWQARHQIVILDRTETYFDDAINVLNGRFSQNRINGESAILDSHAPIGGEVLAFREAHK